MKQSLNRKLMRSRSRVLTFISCTFSVCFFQSVHARETEIPPPVPPFIARVTIPAAWTVTFSRPAEDERAGTSKINKLTLESAGPGLLESPAKANEIISIPVIRVLNVTRSTAFTREIETYSDGTTLTSYIFNVARISKHLTYNGLIRSRKGPLNARYSPDYSALDFTGLDWLSPNNYKGVQALQNVLCYVFESEIAIEETPGPVDMGISPSGASKVTARACISVDTKLPVSLQIGSETRIYQFGKPSQEDLTYPSEVAAEIEAWRAELTSATRPPSPP